ADPTNGHLCASAQGRADTPFRYGSIEVSPLAIRSVFATAPTVLEYQIRQTARGVEALIIAEQEPRAHTLAAQLEQALRTAGIHAPEVAIRRVENIERDAQTGKSRRFIPITGDPRR
ncbi:MAG: hypothetical protein JO304_19030, partial [Solirubrobacterales bacterium]|nr:hypothetical protein [Solirubrobacterales bacterium]